MRHHNSVFHGVQKHVPWAEFERLVDKHGSGPAGAPVGSKSQFPALLFGQLSGPTARAPSRRDCLSHADRLSIWRRRGRARRGRRQCTPASRAVQRPVRPQARRPAGRRGAYRDAGPHPRRHPHRTVLAAGDGSARQRPSRGNMSPTIRSRRRRAAQLSDQRATTSPPQRPSGRPICFTWWQPSCRPRPPPA